MAPHILHIIFLILTVTLADGLDHDTALPPNVLLFLADDLGYGDLGCYGNTSLRTPNVDKLAAEGVKLTQSLAAASLCTPSRAGFLTGRYPIRSGMAPSNFMRVAFLSACGNGLPSWEVTLAEVAKEAGYTTALLGKWHLGWSTDQSDPEHHHPLNQGFDYFYGIPLTLLRDFDPRETKSWCMDRPVAGLILPVTCVMTLVCTWLLIRMGKLGRLWTVVAVGLMVCIFLAGITQYWIVNNLTLLNSFFYRNYQLVEQPIQLTQVTRKIVREGVQFLEERGQDKRPFLLLVSWPHVHTALASGPLFRGRSAHGPYGDAVEEMDWGVGEVMGALERSGLGNNTLVYFTSDNGGHVEEHEFAGRRAGGYNGVLKGGKAHGAPEGGIRVPTILKWPGKVPAGHTVDEPVSLMDVMPTIVQALHVQLPANHIMDGKDLLPLVSGEEEVSPHEFLFHYCQSEVHAIRYRPRDGNQTWKLVLYEPAYLQGTDRCNFICPCPDATRLDPPRLFDLTSDPGERRPLVAEDLPEYGALVEVMLRALEQHRDSLVPVVDMFSVHRMLWQPWRQPVCQFPHFHCQDDKFAGVFED